MGAALVAGLLLVGTGCGTATDSPDTAGRTLAPVVETPAGQAEFPEPPASPSAEPESTVAPSDPESAQPSASTSPTTAAAGTPAAGSRGTALALLATLPVKGRAAMTGYSREAYGQAWADVDRNGCDTRNDVLRRDLTEQQIRPGTHGCLVESGALVPDPYLGARVDFIRGGASEVDIDHVVALADSWVTGAAGWEERKRIAFGNDPLNLLAVAAGANRQKGAGDAATWLPRSAYRCAYVARQVAVKAKYGLWVKPAEKDAMARVLGACPAEEPPASGPLELPPPGLGSAGPRPTSSPRPVPAPAPGTGGTDPRYSFCTEAKAAGYGPYHRGTDPEYAWYRDADSDGAVCE